MIDFRLDERGDIILSSPEEYDTFRIDFAIKEYPLMLITFNTDDEADESKKSDNILEIQFFTDETELVHGKKLETVKEDEEKAQSIAIRLKTELGELDGLYYNFGSELAYFRHLDLLNDTYWSKIEEKVKVAISDVGPYAEASVTISRIEGEGGFKNTALCISIEGNNLNQILHI